jgi:hypothetical protein
MRIKHSVKIAAAAAAAADQMGLKPSRYGWGVRSEQAERLARMLEEERPSSRKAKAGLQGLRGRVRVENAIKEDEVEIEMDNRPREWGVVCEGNDGIYVTTAVVDVNGQIEVDTVATASTNDRIIGVTNWLKSSRFPYVRSMLVENIDHPFFADKIAEVIGYSSDNYLAWYIPAK